MTDRYPYSMIILDYEFAATTRTWLIENIGLPYHTWTSEYIGLGYIRVRFLREEDAVLCSLKWS